MIVAPPVVTHRWCVLEELMTIRDTTCMTSLW